MKLTDLVDAKSKINFPVSYDMSTGSIFDSKGERVVVINAVTRTIDSYDAIGYFVAECINSHRQELMIID